jgi:holo-[acyl-carrier protein] synthase
MELLGSGIDVVEIPRIRAAIERHGPRFMRKVYTPAEEAYCRSKADLWASFAARWAAKEAVYKAYGHGWGHIWWLNRIEVIKEPSGKPAIRLLREAVDLHAGRGVKRIELSLTHGREVAIAQALLLG